MVAVNLVSSEVRQGTYDREQSCTTDEAQTVLKKNSKLHCYFYRHKALFLKLSQLVPDTRQDIIEGVETLDRRVRYDREQSCTTDGAHAVVKKNSKLHCYLYRHKALFLKLSQLVPDTKQDIIEGVETLDRRVRYDREQSCTTDGAQTVVKKKSKIHCASTCNEQSDCREYNFDQETKDCSLYKPL